MMLQLFPSKARVACELLSSNPGRFVRAISGKLRKFLVYAAPTAAMAPPPAISGVFCRRLSAEDLLDAAIARHELSEQKERLATIGISCAYGVFCDGKLAHISWLVTEREDRGLRLRRVKLKSDEAEITTCYTLPEFRGRGFQSVAIRTLAGIAERQRVTYLYAICGTDNFASQRGIEKAGLSRRGSVYQWVLPLMPSAPGIIIRPFRYLPRLGGSS